ncbi:hypothetical protein M427DRAFT_132194 [Gonapodya prolifera JEL478]|uniref:Uncharacterized protein n=1 Tax=Gonapodya prolifera (strain JEL478) TaxID=1344416 RepID=A0A139AQY3_GONPJ|nr:hypothetical protein M427DRAFT_132194 [Gonapodya prolifera JEL478]|eukprot:KXS19167.1 hypothetical protein M427DRAFT_132194 [Gonapodya prolifera JEL478]
MSRPADGAVHETPKPPALPSAEDIATNLRTGPSTHPELYTNVGTQPPSLESPTFPVAAEIASAPRSDPHRDPHRAEMPIPPRTSSNNRDTNLPSLPRPTPNGDVLPQHFPTSLDDTTLGPSNPPLPTSIPPNTSSKSSLPSRDLPADARSVLSALSRVSQLEEQCREAEAECNELWSQLGALQQEANMQRRYESHVRKLELEANYAIEQLSRHVNELHTGRWTGFDVRQYLPDTISATGDTALVADSVESIVGNFATLYNQYLEANKGLNLLKLRIMSQQQWIRDARTLLVQTDAATEKDADAAPTTAAERGDLQSQIESMEHYRESKQTQLAEDEAEIKRAIQDRSQVVGGGSAIIELLQAELDKAKADQALAQLMTDQVQLEMEKVELRYAEQIAAVRAETDNIREELTKLN